MKNIKILEKPYDKSIREDGEFKLVDTLFKNYSYNIVKIKNERKMSVNFGGYKTCFYFKSFIRKKLISLIYNIKSLRV